MKENGEVTDTNVGDIEEDIKKLRESIIEEKYHIYNKDLKIILEHILSDYKRVLKENEHKTEKIENQKNELAILNNKQKDLKKLQNTLNSYRGQFKRQKKEIKEKDELIEKMKNYLLKENKMCDFLECEEK